MPTQPADAVYPSAVLGHRTGTRGQAGDDGRYVEVDTYTTQPISLVRPETGSTTVSLHCERCGDRVQLTMWAAGRAVVIGGPESIGTRQSFGPRECARRFTE